MKAEKLLLLFVIGVAAFVFAGIAMLRCVEPKTPTAIVLTCLYIVGFIVFLSVSVVYYMRWVSEN